MALHVDSKNSSLHAVTDDPVSLEGETMPKLGANDLPVKQEKIVAVSTGTENANGVEKSGGIENEPTAQQQTTVSNSNVLALISQIYQESISNESGPESAGAGQGGGLLTAALAMALGNDHEAVRKAAEEMAKKIAEEAELAAKKREEDREQREKEIQQAKRPGGGPIDKEQQRIAAETFGRSPDDDMPTA